MAPQELVGRYERYKHGTRNLVYWLTKTAANCGDLKPALRSLQSDLPSKSSKRRPATPEIEVRASELVELARMISGKTPPMELPEGIVLIVDDVIAARRVCADWYHAQTTEKNEKMKKDNEGHEGFIEILHEVRRILKVVRARASASKGPEEASKQSSKKKKSKSKGQTKLGSAFEDLELEEPGSNPLGEAPSISITTASSGPTTVQVRLEKQKNDADFVIWCYLQDLADVRNFSTRAWEEYRKGDLSYITASIITSTALGLLRRAHENFVRSSSLQDDDWSTLTSYLGINFFARGQAIWMHPKNSSEDPQRRMPEGITNFMQLLCPIAFYVLLSFERDIKSYCTTEGDDAGCLRFDELFHNLERPLLCLVPIVDDATHHRKGAVVMDEFFEGLGEIHRTGIRPVWMVIACQMYLDVYDVIGDSADLGCKIVPEHIESCRELRATVKEYEERTQRKNSCTCDVQAALQLLEGATQRVETFDGDREDPRNNNDRLNIILTLERAMPAFAGTYLLESKLVLYKASVEFAQHRSHVLSVAHLYKALRAYGKLKANWPDMDFVLANFGTKQPLVAKCGHAYDHAKAQQHYMLDCGIGIKDVKDTANGVRKEHSCRIKKSAKRVTVTWTLLRELNRRPFFDPCRTSNATIKSLSQQRNELLDHVLRGLAVDEATAGSKGLRSISHLHDSFTGPQLLTTLKKALVHDEPALNFDFIRFTLSCTDLLDQIVALIGNRTEVKKYSGDSRHMAMMFWLLSICDNSATGDEVGKIFQAHIEANGNVHSKHSYDQSSGRIPKALRPDIGSDPNKRKPWQQCLGTFFGHAGAKSMFSGKAMAVYHTDLKAEEASPSMGYRSSIAGAGTDPDSRIEYAAGCRIISHGSAIPKALMDAFEAKRSTIPEIESALQRLQTMTRIRKIHAAGRSLVEAILNQIRTASRRGRRTRRRRPATGSLQEGLSARCSDRHSLLEDYWLPIPITFWLGGEEPPESAAEDFARCAFSVFLTRCNQDLEGVKARIVDGLVWGAAKERSVEEDLTVFVRELMKEAEALQANEMSEKA